VTYKLNVSEEDLISIQNRYAELENSEKAEDEHTFKASFIMLFAVLDSYWEELNFTFGGENLKPLYDLVRLTALEFHSLPKKKADLTKSTHLRETRKVILFLLNNNNLIQGR